MSSEESNVTCLVAHLFRHKAGQMISVLTRIFGPRHLDLAEDVVQEALSRALEQWPFRGVPDDPAAWLFQVARNRALDVVRREAALRDKSAEIVQAFESRRGGAGSGAGDLAPEIADDALAMVFMCCHPTLTPERSVALTLKLAGGFSAAEIARALLADEAAVAQRIVRAKRQLRDERVAFELPAPAELRARLEPVLQVIYLLFNEGYGAHAGDGLVRRELCEEAIRLGLLVAEHPATGLPQCHALVALMLLQASRLEARTDSLGEPFVLRDQDRTRWDQGLIARGLRRLEQSASGDMLSAYHVQAAIAACHAVAPSYEATDWSYILELYDQLLVLDPSPVVALNRAVALARVKGPQAGIEALESIRRHPSLARYYLLPATLGEFWMETGDRTRAADWYRLALECPCSEPERRLVARRLEATGAAARR